MQAVQAALNIPSLPIRAVVPESPSVWSPEFSNQFLVVSEHCICTYSPAFRTMTIEVDTVLDFKAGVGFMFFYILHSPLLLCSNVLIFL